MERDHVVHRHLVLESDAVTELIAGHGHGAADHDSHQAIRVPQGTGGASEKSVHRQRLPAAWSSGVRGG